MIFVVKVIFYIWHSQYISSLVSDPILSSQAPVCSVLIYNPTRRHEVWRFLTYSLVHSGFGHIILNVTIQLIVGLPLEMAHGSLPVAAVYLVGVVSGSLATSCWEPKVYLTGASGGVYALIAAHLSNLILNWHEERLIIRLGPKTGATASHGGLVRMLKVTAIVAFVVADVATAVYSGPRSSTGYTAHLVGASMGLVTGIMVLDNQRIEAWEQRLKLVCSVLLTSFMLATVLWQLTANNIYTLLYESQYFLNETIDDSLDTCVFTKLS